MSCGKVPKAGVSGSSFQFTATDRDISLKRYSGTHSAKHECARLAFWRCFLLPFLNLSSRAGARLATIFLRISDGIASKVGGVRVDILERRGTAL